MKAVILAGGEGRRLRPVTGELPKPMVPLAGIPVMERIVTLLRDNGFTDICATLCYHPEAILRHFGDGSKFGVRFTHRIETEPLGTAGSVRACQDFYGDEDFLVISGDAACSFDLRGLMQAHRASGAAATLALHPHADPLRYGLVVLDRSGHVRHIVEKPDWAHVVSDLVNTGIYVLSPRAMAYVPEYAPFDFAKELFPRLLQNHEPLLGVEAEGYWCDIGTPRSYYQCCLDVLDGKLEPPAPMREKQHCTVPCLDRARLMRTASEAFVELGADFSDGLSFRDGSWRVRVRPMAETPALEVEADSEEAARETAHLLSLMEDAAR